MIILNYLGVFLPFLNLTHEESAAFTSLASPGCSPTLDEPLSFSYDLWVSSRHMMASEELNLLHGS